MALAEPGAQKLKMNSKQM